MLLNFQRQFAPAVSAGQKRQTIRAAGKRKHAPKVGETAYCYTGLRTRNTVKLGAWPIERVQVIRFTITEDDTVDDVILGADRLTGGQLHELAVADGFKGWPAMAKWFAGAHDPGDFYGWVIGWTWSLPSGEAG